MFSTLKTRRKRVANMANQPHHYLLVLEVGIINFWRFDFLGMEPFRVSWRALLWIRLLQQIGWDL